MIGNQWATWVWSMNSYLSKVPILPLGGKFKMWKFFKQHQCLPDVWIFILKYYIIPTLSIAHFRPSRFSTLTVYLCLHASFISIFLQICQVVVKKVSYKVQSSFRISNNETETATTVMPSFNSVNLKCFPSRKHDEWLIFLQKFRSFLCMRKS